MELEVDDSIVVKLPEDRLKAKTPSPVLAWMPNPYWSTSRLLVPFSSRSSMAPALEGRTQEPQ